MSRKTNQDTQEKIIDDFSGEELRAESPKFFGMDYFRVIYGAAAFLVSLMIVVYLTIEDPKVKRMTLVQGSLSVVLILVMAWYHTKVEKNRQEKLKKQQMFKKKQ